MSELITELTAGAKLLADSSFNPVSLTAGVELLLRFVTLQRPSGHQDFKVHKQNLVVRAKEFMAESHRCVEKVVSLASSLIKDDAVSRCMYVRCERTTDLLWHSVAMQVIMTHSYSRVVVQSLIQAARQRKRFQVVVTESRPVGLHSIITRCLLKQPRLQFGLGVKTHALLTRAGIPCQIILDSAVCYVINKVDMVMLGAEALAENGGCVHSVPVFKRRELMHVIPALSISCAASCHVHPVLIVLCRSAVRKWP